MKIHQYKDYEEYVYWQEWANRGKLHKTFAREVVIDTIALYQGPNVHNIICHGTRNGSEQKFFKNRYPDANIIGTEISSTAINFPMTVQHDFSVPNQDWLGIFDIVYSNSFDHSIVPEQTLNTWKNQLNNNGRLYLEFAELQSVGSITDPMLVTNEEVQELIEKAGLKVVHKITDICRNGGLVFVAEKK